MSKEHGYPEDYLTGMDGDGGRANPQQIELAFFVIGSSRERVMCVRLRLEWCRWIRNPFPLANYAVSRSK